LLGTFDRFDLGLENPKSVDHPGGLFEDGSGKRKLFEFPIQSKKLDQIPGVGGYETESALMKNQPVGTAPMFAERLDRILQIGLPIAISSLSNSAGIV
jgi:hypothetical protein